MDTGGRLAHLALIPPGPQLTTALAAIDPSGLNGHELVELAASQQRMISHLQAGLAETLTQVQYCPPGDADSPAARTEQNQPVDRARHRGETALERR